MLVLWLRVQAHLGSLRRATGREEGQTLTEYALILVLIAMVVIGMVALFGEQLDTTYNEIVGDLSALISAE